MFTVGKYKVVFKRAWQTFGEDGITGRYDTQCTIFLEGSETTFIGLAKLHPNDQPDKIVGKKVALEDAMICGFRTMIVGRKPVKFIVWHPEFQSKSERHVIWTAFWAWVESWKPVKEN